MPAILSMAVFALVSALHFLFSVRSRKLYMKLNFLRVAERGKGTQRTLGLDRKWSPKNSEKKATSQSEKIINKKCILFYLAVHRSKMQIAKKKL